MSPDDRVPSNLRKMLLLDPARGREDLEQWIALNDHAAGLFEETVAKYEAADESTLDHEYASERREHRACLTDLRDRYAQAANDARTVRDRLVS